MNILFVCSRNKWRSKTAETIYKKEQGHQFKSAGTEKSARIRLNQNLIDWADLIFVNEKKHKTRMQDKFDLRKLESEIIILDILDEYTYMDEELIEMLRASIDPYVFDESE